VKFRNTALSVATMAVAASAIVAVPAIASASPNSCYPSTSSGNCYEPGEFCPTRDAGMSGVAGDGKNIKCQDNNGLRWEPYSPAPVPRHHSKPKPKPKHHQSKPKPKPKPKPAPRHVTPVTPTSGCPSIYSPFVDDSGSGYDGTSASYDAAYDISHGYSPSSCYDAIGYYNSDHDFIYNIVAP
jgi:hypothetical protein